MVLVCTNVLVYEKRVGSRERGGEKCSAVCSNVGVADAEPRLLFKPHLWQCAMHGTTPQMQLSVHPLDVGVVTSGIGLGKRRR